MGDSVALAQSACVTCESTLVGALCCSTFFIDFCCVFIGGVKIAGRGTLVVAKNIACMY